MVLRAVVPPPAPIYLIPRLSIWLCVFLAKLDKDYYEKGSRFMDDAVCEMWSGMARDVALTVTWASVFEQASRVITIEFACMNLLLTQISTSPGSYLSVSGEQYHNNHIRYLYSSGP